MKSPKLSPELHRELEAYLAQLQPLVESLRTAGCDIEKLQASHAALEAEVANGDSSVDATDATAVQLLETKRAQIVLLGQQIDARLSRLANRAGPVREALHHAQDLIFRATKGLYDSELRRITDVFVPFFRDRTWAETAAVKTDFIQALGAFRNRNYGGALDVLAEGIQVLGILQRLLDCEEVFKFAK